MEIIPSKPSEDEGILLKKLSSESKKITIWLNIFWAKLSTTMQPNDTASQKKCVDNAGIMGETEKRQGWEYLLLFNCLFFKNAVGNIWAFTFRPL